MNFKYKRPVITPCKIDKSLIPDESKQINVLIQMKNDNKSEAMSLIEGGFQYVTEIDGVKLFKKT